METEYKYKRKPDWLKIKLPMGDSFSKVNHIVHQQNLHTICTSGNCPNMADCWGRGTATLMILGDICTRSCKFCAVATGKPLPVDCTEPLRVAESVQQLQLKHCVLTSVDRDDLDDGGANIWAETIKQIKNTCPDVTIEALIPDFNANLNLIDLVIFANPEVISHNLETVKRLTPLVRTKAKYETSLEVIKHISASGIISKSGIMLGLGETNDEIFETMDDLLSVGCKVFTLGQYLQPTKKHLSVIEYVHPDTFEEYKIIGMKKGFKHVESAPLVRSSYHAEKHIE